MRVFAEPQPITISKCVHRISVAIKDLLVDIGHEPVTEMSEAEAMIYYPLSNEHFNQLVEISGPKPYMQFIIGDSYTPEFLQETIDNSLGSWSHILFEDNTDYIRTPYGFDPSIFYVEPERQKKYAILTTGYVSETELIDECHEAANSMGMRFVHIGNKRVSDRNGVYVENISDDEMRKFYNESYFVAGTRLDNGFELPVIEGYACGARPLCLDAEPYRKWFDQIACYVDGTVESMQEMMQLGIGSWDWAFKPYFAPEEESLKHKYEWLNVIEEYWREGFERGLS